MTWRYLFIQILFVISRHTHKVFGAKSMPCDIRYILCYLTTKEHFDILSQSLIHHFNEVYQWQLVNHIWNNETVQYNCGTKVMYIVEWWSLWYEIVFQLWLFAQNCQSRNGTHVTNDIHYQVTYFPLDPFQLARLLKGLCKYNDNCNLMHMNDSNECCLFKFADSKN